MIQIHWEILSEDDAGWNECRCLYAYLHPKQKEILYIGKAWGITVKERWRQKPDFWEDLEKKRNIKEHIPLIGRISLLSRNKLTWQLLADVESLLIQQEQPWGNIQSKKTRISRPRMRVECRGRVWPGQHQYIDNA